MFFQKITLHTILGQIFSILTVSGSPASGEVIHWGTHRIPHIVPLMAVVYSSERVQSKQQREKALG